MDELSATLPEPGSSEHSSPTADSPASSSAGSTPRTHEIPLEPSVFAGYFSRDRTPVRRIRSGDRLVLDIPEANWFRSEQPKPLKHDSLEPWDARGPEDQGHCLAGPFHIEGAQPGMTLEVRIIDVVPGDWGWSGAEQNDTPWGRRLGLTEDSWLGLLWSIDADAGFARNQLGDRVRIRPFPGVVGMPPNLPGRHSTVPPRVCGGNLDCRELVAGATLFLPISVEGALVSFGDGHALQGDGEVSGVAVECPLRRLEVEMHLHEDLEIPAPRAETPAGKIAFGLHEDMNEAWALALDNMLKWMMELHGISRLRATALASLCVDLRVTQVVNQVCGVHAILREDDLNVGQPEDELASEETA